jgi:hypothetical protein
MVNGAWSEQLVIEFLLQVFTIRQASRVPDCSSSFVRTRRGLTAAGGQKGRFPTVV